MAPTFGGYPKWAYWVTKYRDRSTLAETRDAATICHPRWDMASREINRNNRKPAASTVSVSRHRLRSYAGHMPSAALSRKSASGRSRAVNLEDFT
jgi:hypothetical protein